MSKSSSLALRDAQIIHDARRNVPRRDLALKYGVSEARISQIVSQGIDVDEDLRAWLMQGYYGDLANLQGVIDGKGRPITSGKGEHVINGETGEYAYDPAPRVDAIRTAAVIRKNIAQLMGNEKPPPKVIETSPELITYMEQAQVTFRENVALKEQLTMMQAQLAALQGSVPAEVID